LGRSKEICILVSEFRVSLRLSEGFRANGPLISLPAVVPTPTGVS
jgi:hypothetical protein